jgi:3-methyladenine DNA glycosylase AlkD
MAGVREDPVVETEYVVVADGLHAALRAHASPDRAAREKRYLKSDLDFMGVPVPVIRAEVRRMLRAHPEWDHGHAHGHGHDAVVGLAGELWSRPTHELRRGAVELLVACDPLLTAADLALVEQLIRTAQTWAYVDDLAERVAGRLLLRQPAAVAVEMDRWSRDADFWIRRSALLALLPSLRAGSDSAIRERFTRYADRMVEEKEFFIRKAIGWVLREISKQDPAWTADWVEQRISTLSGVTFREAVRRLEPRDRDRLIEARPSSA